MSDSPRAVAIYNIPAPYRVPVDDVVAAGLKGRYHVIYCDVREPNRHWRIPEMNHDHVFLKSEGRTYRHNDPSVLTHLRRLKPDVVITGGFMPTMLYAIGWARLFGRAQIPITDGTIQAEARLGRRHRLVRRMVFRYSKAFLGMGEKSAELYRSYGIADEHIFKSPYSIDPSRFLAARSRESEYDLVFSGQFIERKQPLFFAEVCRMVKQVKPDLKVLVMGDGPQKETFFAKLDRDGIDYHYPGFVQQDELPKLYGKGRVYLFPTQRDAWGVVAHEALAAGLPVITCAEAGAAGELVRDGKTGFVLPLDARAWADKTLELLTNHQLYRRIKANGTRIAKEYNYENSAAGVLAAIEHALSR